MPVKNINHFSNQSYNGRITGLSEDEKKAIDDSGLLDNTASKLIYDEGLILLDKFGNVIEGQDDPVKFSDKFNVENNLVDFSVESVDMVKLPAVPTNEDGTYVLKAIVASGAVTYSWVKE